MGRAGYDVQAIKQFWPRMENLRSGQNQAEMDVSHPTTVERLAVFEVTLTEIQEKRDRGDILQPVLEQTRCLEGCQGLRFAVKSDPVD